MKKSIFMLLLLVSSSILAQEKKSEPIRPALLVIDIQNQFLPMVEQREKDIALYMINAYIDEFRKRGIPVIRIYHSDKEEGPFPGTPEFEFPADTRILPDDPQIIKTYANSFTKTDLDKILKEKGINTLFLCGLSSVGCVLATWFGAKDYDYKAFMLKNAIMSHSSQYTKQAEDMFGAVEWEVVSVLIE
jgi:nicotinamidase-related amidase